MCFQEGCGKENLGGSPFCLDHHLKWQQSPEGKRAHTALSDYIHRSQAEAKNATKVPSGSNGVGPPHT